MYKSSYYYYHLIIYLRPLLMIGILMIKSIRMHFSANRGHSLNVGFIKEGIHCIY